MFEVDWQHLFGIEKPVLELVIRGTVMYWFLFLMFRFVMRRDVGAIGIADVLLIAPARHRAPGAGPLGLHGKRRAGQRRSTRRRGKRFAAAR